MSKMSKAVAVLGIVAGLGVAALPLSSYAVAGIPGDAKPVTAEAQVGDSIELDITNPTDNTPTTSIVMKNVVANATVNEASAKLTIRTNSVKGYNVTIRDADEENALAASAASGITQTIPAGVPTQTQNFWGVKAAKTGATASDSGVTIDADYRNYYGVLKSNDSTGTDRFATRNGSTPLTGDELLLTFGVTIDMSIPAGSYTDNVVVTATTK